MSKSLLFGSLKKNLSRISILKMYQDFVMCVGNEKYACAVCEDVWCDVEVRDAILINNAI